MTIKVLREGLKPGETLFRGECQTCSGQFEWQEADGHTPKGSIVSEISCPTLGCDSVVTGYKPLTVSRPQR